MPDQRSLSDQLRDLIPIANKNGMYDAADFLRDFVERAESARGRRKLACSYAIRDGVGRYWTKAGYPALTVQPSQALIFETRSAADAEATKLNVDFLAQHGGPPRKIWSVVILGV